MLDWTTVALLAIGVVAFAVVGYLAFAFFAFRSVRKMQDDLFKKDDDSFGRR